MNIIEITNKFPTELHAVQFFEKHRWGKQVKCAYCESENISKRNKDFRFNCLDCKKTFFVTTGTKLHATKTSLQTWLFAFSIVSDAKKGLSALQLQRNIDISYPTAWSMYHKIRELMIIENDEIKLEGVVEMDETWVGGKPRIVGKLAKGRKIPHLDEKISKLHAKGHRFGRQKGNKAIPDPQTETGRHITNNAKVAGIVQRNGNVIAEVISKITYSELKGLVEKYVDEDDSVLITDQLKSYNKMNSIIDHIAIDHTTLYSYRGVNTNTIESFWAIVKRGIIGQYHQVSKKHLPNYIAEFVFKYNNRKVDDMFTTLVRNSVKPYSL